MPLKIRVRNFQSIQDATIEVEGLTVVTGSNNSGKTALLRATRGVFTNTPGTSFVRHGTAFTTVEIEFQDGHKVLWKKGPKVKPTYILNNGHPIHPGRGIPDEVERLGVVPLKVGSEILWPQIARQFTGQIFLLNQSGSVVAEAVADVDRVGRLSRAMKKTESDRRSSQATLKVRRKDKEDLEASLEFFRDLDSVGVLVENIESSLVEVDGIQATLFSLQGIQSRLQNAQKQIHRFSGVTDISVPGKEQVQEIQTLRDSLAGLISLKVQVSHTRLQVQRLSHIKKIKVPDAQEALRLRGDLKDRVQIGERHKAAQKALQEASEGFKIASSIDLEDMSGRILQARRMRKALSYLLGLQSQMRQAEENIQDLRNSLGHSSKALSVIQSRVQEILGDLGECPTCGQICEGHKP